MVAGIEMIKCGNPRCETFGGCANPQHEENTMWKQYRRTGLSEMRPYIQGEDLTGISVQQEDTPEEGGMIARNPKNHKDQWHVGKDYFNDNLEPA